MTFEIRRQSGGKRRTPNAARTYRYLEVAKPRECAGMPPLTARSVSLQPIFMSLGQNLWFK